MASITSTSFLLCFLCSVVVIHSTSEDCTDICWSDVCEFHFTLSFGTTTTSQRKDELTTHTSHIPATPISAGSCREKEITTTGDGRERSVMLINGEFPGPTLQVKEGAQVIVHVSNYLQTLSTTIHWHGLSMSNSQSMDGVPYITQCPIPPGHTFTYNFTAHLPGTHWYHSHMSNHRRDGLYGLFIVHKSKPDFMEFPLVLSDWYERDGVTDQVTDLRRGVYGKYPDPVSSLINGRGRHTLKPEAPLTSFNVKPNKVYKFRSVNAASDLGYEVTVDGHMLTITSWDGSDIEPMSVHGFNIFPGERIDFTVKTAKTEGSFWIRVRSLARHGVHHIHSMSESHHQSPQRGKRGVNMDRSDGREHNSSGPTAHSNMKMQMDSESRSTERPNHTSESDHKDHDTSNQMDGANPQNGLAVLTYSETTHEDPKTNSNPCTEQSSCLIFNCYREYSIEEYKRCVLIKDVFSSDSASSFTEKDEAVAEEHFLNVGMISGATIASKEFIGPLSPMYQHYNHSFVECDSECNDPSKGCACTHKINLPYGKIIQIVFSNIEKLGMSADHPNHHGSHAIGHPMHIHGHRFAVMDQGMGSAPSKGGEKPQNNPDIHCDTDLCKNPKWSVDKLSEKSQLSRKRPPLKDTIIVPPGGYVVLRMRMDNPGYWLVHCHLMRDHLDGMAMLLGVAPEQVGPAPSHHPVCHPQAYQCANNKCHGYTEQAEGYYENVSSPSVSWAVMIVMTLLFLVAGLVIGSLMTLWCFRCKRKRSYITNFPQHLIM